MDDSWIVFTILAVTIALFVSDRLRLDLVALLSLLALLLTGILTPAEALAGFADPIVIMIAGLFVVGGAMFRTGVAQRFGRALGRLGGSSRAGLTLATMLGAASLSAVMSSTGTVAVMLPVAAAMAWNARLSPSLLLMPLAIGSLLGGLLTLIGTPPNIVVSNQLASAGFTPFGFLDFTPVGIVMLIIGLAFMVLFGGRLLPARASAEGPEGGDVSTVPGADLVTGYGIGAIARLRVDARSPLVGRSPAGAALRRRYGINVVGIRRRRGPGGTMQRRARTAEEPLRAGDEIDVQGPREAIERLRTGELLVDVDSRSMPGATLAEVLLPPRSRIIGRSLADVRFRERFGANVLSIRRQGAIVPGDIATTQLRFADTLLVAGSPRRIGLLRQEAGDFVVVAQTDDDGTGARGRTQAAAVIILAGMMTLLAFEVVAPVTAVLVAAVAVVLAGCVDMEQAYRSINWESIVLIAAILPMATALQKTGGMDLMVAQLQRVSAWGPLAMLGALFLLTNVLSHVISNTAATVLLAPVAIGAAAGMGVAPQPLLMGVAVAASTAFATPIATPVNMLVLGPGAYRFGDFLRVGAVLQAVIFLAVLLVVPLFFPF